MRVTEAQARSLEALDELKVGDIELNFPVKGRDRAIEVMLVAGAVIVQWLVNLGIKACDEIQYAGLDVVHVRAVAEADPVILHRSLLEFRERFLDVRAVVRFLAISADPDAVSLNVHAVLHCSKIVVPLPGGGYERREAVRRGVVGEVIPERLETARDHVELGKVFGQGADRLTVDGHRIYEPAFLLVPVVELAGLSELLAHLPHVLCECLDRRQDRFPLKVAQDVMAVADSRCIVQRNVEELLELVFVPPGGHGLQDLIEIQVGEEGGFLALISADSIFGALEEDAVESDPQVSCGSCRGRRVRLRGIKTTEVSHAASTASASGRSHQPLRRFKRASSPAVMIPVAAGTGAGRRRRLSPPRALS